MSDINWIEGAVCYINGRQRNHESIWINGVFDDEVGIDDFDDFQLNEIRTGDYIEASELDTEQKYNEVVEVFGLFGFKRFNNASYAETIKAKTDSSCLKVNPSGKLICNWHKGDRQLNYHQIIAIGKLKRMMLERECAKTQLEKWGGYAGKENTVKYNQDSMIIRGDGLVITKPKRRNKSKQAYDILESLDYEYDLIKQRWFKKQYID